MLYCRWRAEKNRESYIDQRISQRVSDEYTRVGIDISSVDLQFSKYEILSLTPDLLISNDKDSQTVYHTKIQKYFWINVPRRLLWALKALKAQNFYKQIAFNITMITDMIPMMEDMERGEKLKLIWQRCQMFRAFPHQSLLMIILLLNTIERGTALHLKSLGRI